MKKAYFGSRKHNPLAPSLYPTGNAGILIHVSKVTIQKQSLIFIIKMTKDAYGTISITTPVKKDNYICLDQWIGPLIKKNYKIDHKKIKVHNLPTLFLGCNCKPEEFTKYGECKTRDQ